MSATLSPVANQQFFDDNGAVLSSGLLYTFSAGTSTPATTWQDADQNTENDNPIQLGSDGRAVIYLAAANYKFILTDGANFNPLLPTTTIQGNIIWTQDQIQSVGLSSSAAILIFNFGGDSTSPITQTSYPVGATYEDCHAGTSLWHLDSNSLAAGTYILQGMMVGSGGVVSAELVNLTDAPTTPIVTLSWSGTTGRLVQSSAITFAAGGVSVDYGIKVKVDSGSGEVWALNVVKTA